MSKELIDLTDKIIRTHGNIVGKRIHLNEMKNERDPVTVGDGTITNFSPMMGVINVRWDNGRSLAVIVTEDDYEILD